MSHRSRLVHGLSKIFKIAWSVFFMVGVTAEFAPAASISSLPWCKQRPWTRLVTAAGILPATVAATCPLPVVARGRRCQTSGNTCITIDFCVRRGSIVLTRAEKYINTDALLSKQLMCYVMSV